MTHIQSRKEIIYLTQPSFQAVPHAVEKQKQKQHSLLICSGFCGLAETSVL